MKEVLLIKNGELALKGQNRRSFEEILAKNIKRALKPLGRFEITHSQSTMQAAPAEENIDFFKALELTSKVFGAAKISRALVTEKNMETILPACAEYLKNELIIASTFKVEAKRSDKKFPLKSPEICAKAGEYILEKFPNLTVDVHNPDITVHIEIRDSNAYVHSDPVAGAGGLPVGTAGKAAVLISGGIDSPVAAWMMAKRGISLTAVHFASPPYTSERSEEKVIALLRKVAKYSGTIKLFIVPFTEIQEGIAKKCDYEYFTLVMRRFMMKMAESIAVKENCEALITGESVGQVASQTMKALACTDAAVNMPVFRPVIGMDKDEIISVSRKIDTFETSILPYEDCCTVFTPRHPRTKPRLGDVIAQEERLSLDDSQKIAIDNARIIFVE